MLNKTVSMLPKSRLVVKSKRLDPRCAVRFSDLVRKIRKEIKRFREW